MCWCPCDVNYEDVSTLLYLLMRHPEQNPSGSSARLPLRYLTAPVAPCGHTDKGTEPTKEEEVEEEDEEEVSGCCAQ